ncbi:MAG: hypothetical protein Ta2G_10370 [Termitinemataceae bacterium]|nr:MAG: hypothetical protein Ta2G_10370 [Termitinemataceae bacterium]
MYKKKDVKMFLAEFITTDVVCFIAEDTGISIPEAMNKFYNSTVFEKLLNYKTGIYQEGSGYVYELYKIEQKYGKLVQVEI